MRLPLSLPDFDNLALYRIVETNSALILDYFYRWKCNLTSSRTGYLGSIEHFIPMSISLAFYAGIS